MSKAMITKFPKKQRMSVDGFTWEREDGSDGEEQWILVDGPKDLGLYFWCKNYGPPPPAQPDWPFSGWRYGSGGPFNETAYPDREATMRAASVYLRERLDKRIADLERQLTRMKLLRDKVRRAMRKDGNR